MHDFPAYRIFELEKIAESRPKIVVMCYPPYNWNYIPTKTEVYTDYFDFRTRFAADRIKINDIERSIYNETELNSIVPDPLHLVIYKQKYIYDSCCLLLSKFSLINYKIKKPHPWDLFDFKNQFNPGRTRSTPTAVFTPKCVFRDIRESGNTKALRYMIDYLKMHNINVILIATPVHPCKRIGCSKEAIEAFARFGNSTKCSYYNLTAFSSAEEFLTDGVHVNIWGRQNLTKKISDILVEEAKNVSH